MNLDRRLQALLDKGNDVTGWDFQRDPVLSPWDLFSGVGRAVDSVTGAPTRAAVGAYITGEDPAAAAKKQFAQNPDLAPSFGLVEDIVLDPLNAVQLGAKAGGSVASRLAALGEVGAVGDDISRLGFYSKLHRLIQEKMGESATPEQILAIARGAKQEEVANTGLESLVKGRDKLTKDEVLAHIKRGTPDVSETIYGDIPKEDPVGMEHRRQIFEQYQPGIDEARAAIDRAESGSARIKAINEHRRLADERDALADSVYSLKIDSVQPTRFGEYTLPGGDDKSYREIALTLPVGQMSDEEAAARYYENWMRRGGDPEFGQLSQQQQQEIINKTPGFTKSAPETFSSSHIKEPNVLVHARVNDRVTPEGKTLFIEELQSDWHQKGRKHGYKGGADDELQKRFNILDKKRNEQIEETSTLWGDVLSRARSITNPSHTENVALPEVIVRQGPQAPSPERIKAIEKIGEENYNKLFQDKEFLEKLSVWKAKNDEFNKVLSEFHDVQQKMYAKQNAVPDAPFKKNWHELMMKRLLRRAAEGDYDSIGWTTGKQQADRYQLSKHIEDIHYSGTNLKAYDKQGNKVIERTGVTEKDLEDYIGKDAAEKLLKQPMNGTLRSLHGVDLDIGDSGMSGSYDKILPDYANKLGKKYGVKTEAKKIITGSMTDLAINELNKIKSSKEYKKGGFNALSKSTQKRAKDLIEEHELARTLEVNEDPKNPTLWQITFADTGEAATTKFFETEDEAYKYLQNADPISLADLGKVKVNKTDTHSMRLTPEMKKDILEKGFPLYTLPPALMLRQRALEE